MNRLKNPSILLLLTVALLVPILAVGVFTTTLSGPQRHMKEVVAAVVNNDEPVELDGLLVPLGRQLAAALVDGQGMGEGESTTFTWVMTNDELAADGLRSGEYNAVVTIPPEFSEAATSTAAEDVTPHQALVTVEMSPRARFSDESLTHTIIRAAAASLGHELTGTYLENIFLGFNTLGDELAAAADGARQLSGGVRELSAGAGELTEGTGALADGVGELSAGTSELATGAGTLAAGAGELSGGTAELAGGAGDLASGLAELAGGMNEFAGGVGDLAGGVGGLKAGTTELDAGASQLAEGATTLAAGSKDYATGVDEFAAGLSELSGGAGQLAGGLGELNDALSVIPPYLDQIETGIQTGAQEVRDLADRLEGASGSVSEIIAQVCAEDPEGAACQILSEYLGQTEDLDRFLAGAAAGLRELAAYMDQATGEEGLGQIQQLFTGIDELAAGADELAGGLGLLSAGSEELSEGAHGLAGGNAEIAQGLRALARGITELDGGVGELAAGVTDLDDGASTLAGATGEAASGGRDLAAGAGALADGARELAGGAGELAGGVGELHAGTADLAAGADQLAQGTNELAEGTAELDSGSSELADGLDEATDAIPNYPDGSRETLAEVIADPLALDATGASFRWLAFFSVVALWAGGLWLLAAYPAVAANAASSTRSAVSLTVQSLKTPLVIAAAQGLGVGAIVGIFANVPTSVALSFTLLAMLASIAFTAVQRGLVAWSGWLGIALTVLIAVVAIATALVSAMPPIATRVVSMLPVGPAIFATQGLEATGQGIAGSLLGLATWGALGIIAVLLATRRAQTR